MITIKNEHDLEQLRLRRDIDTSVIRYIENFFEDFAKQVGEQTINGLSIEKCGVVVLAQITDQDLSDIGYLPNILKAIPEAVRGIQITGENGKTRTILHGLFLTSNEFGIDLIGLEGEISGDIKQKLESELENND